MMRYQAVPVKIAKRSACPSQLMPPMAGNVAVESAPIPAENPLAKVTVLWHSFGLAGNLADGERYD